jgi:F-type H+-transporting ATPase subunit h
LVQELYLKELKAYKPTPLKANDSEGQVLKFAVPATPASPEETDLQSGLAEYEAQTPDVVGASSEGEAAPAEQDFFEEEEEEEGGAHH